MTRFPRIAAASGAGTPATAGGSKFPVTWTAFWPMSLGRSISTGPGRPDWASANASANTAGMSSVRRIR